MSHGGSVAPKLFVFGNKSELKWVREIVKYEFEFKFEIASKNEEKTGRNYFDNEWVTPKHE